jgi:hypothetical protein
MAAQDESNDGWWTASFSFSVEEASPASLWAVLADFGNPGKWASSVLESSAVLEGDPHQAGCVRLCRMKAPMDGSGGELEAQEKLLEIDNLRHHMTYSVVSRNIPILLGLVATLQLLPLTSIDSSDKESDADDRLTCNDSSDQQHAVDKLGARILWTVRRPASPDVDKSAFVHALHSLYTTVVADLRNLFLAPHDAPPRSSVHP